MVAYYVMLCYVMLCYVMLCYVMLYYIGGTKVIAMEPVATTAELSEISPVV
jgi:hypothetical protein